MVAGWTAEPAARAAGGRRGARSRARITRRPWPRRRRSRWSPSRRRWRGRSPCRTSCWRRRSTCPRSRRAPEAGPEAGVVSQRVRDAARAAGEAARAAAGGAAPAAGAVRPQFLAAPLEGGPDDLGRMKGVGPKLAEMLHANGIYHFSQIAAWGPEEIAWIETHMRASAAGWSATTGSGRRGPWPPAARPSTRSVSTGATST